jgi:hypothetical protein
MLVKQVLYHLSHTLRSVSFGYFLDRVSYFCSRPAFNSEPLIYTSWLAGTPDMYHYVQFVC